MVLNKNSFSFFFSKVFSRKAQGLRVFFRFYLVLSFVLLSTDHSIAQDSVLTFEQATIMALENNFDIRIAANEHKKAINLNDPGQAGMLPDLYLSGGYTHADNTTNQIYSNGEVVDRNNAISENLDAGLGLSWTIFDGMKMFSTKKRLNEMSNQSNLAYKLQLEEIILQVIKVYYEITRKQQLLKSTREEILLARERLLISERRFQNGSGSRLDFLHAKTDMNSRLAAELEQKNDLNSSSIELNRILARELSTPFVVADSVIINYRPTLDEIRKKSGASNSLRSYYRSQLLISEFAANESSSLRWPEIKVSGNYIYAESKNDAGFIRKNKNQGFNYGISATLPLFNGFRISKNIKNAKLDVQNARLQLENKESELNAALLVAFHVYQDQLTILKLEEENILAAKEILMISQERFKSGATNIIELKEIQRSYEDDMNRLVNARYNAKISEGNLKNLAGELISY